ncbi:MAG TPA: hypothetical protein VIL86_09290 [Tepidisphaeraceae bacterium]|jgi:hypothetical protein
MAAGVWASWIDLTRPLSASQAAAEFIRQNYPKDVPIIGDYDYAVSAIAGNLDRPVFYISTEQMGTFPQWTTHRKADWQKHERRGVLERSARKFGGRAVVILAYVLGDDELLPEEFKLVATFGKTAVYGDH